MLMKAPSEIFKGIEFVRISSLPGDQKERIWHSLRHDKIIKIVKDQALMNDCVLYEDYLSWLNQHKATAANPAQSTAPHPFFAKLAFK
jgi:hypothetical protein